MTLKVVSNGTPKGTKIWVDGRDISHDVSYVSWILDAKEKVAKCVVTLVASDVEVEATDVTFRVPEKKNEVCYPVAVDCGELKCGVHEQADFSESHFRVEVIGNSMKIYNKDDELIYDGRTGWKQ